ncbi:hypothetical protein ACFL2K_00630 [Candidatus Margulisiibacteriota bacterium]
MIAEIKKLREQFEINTNIIIEPCQENWKKYARWLESIIIDNKDNEIVKKHEILKEKIYKTMDELEMAISNRITEE